MKMPTTINGCTVLDARPSRHGDDNLVVLLHKPHDTITPYLTAVWSPRYENEWFWGHYFSKEIPARVDFSARM